MLRQLLWIVGGIAGAFVGPVALVLCWAFFASFFLAPEIVVVLWMVVAVSGIGFAIAAALARRWRSMIVALTLPMSLAIFLSNFNSFWRQAMSAGEEVHFRLARPGYVRYVARLPADNGPRLEVFVLSEDGWLGSSNEHLAVYDESDEVALPDKSRSAGWLARVKGTYLEYGVGYWRAMGDHFYIVRISF